jgi:hypothetical protein
MNPSFRNGVGGDGLGQSRVESQRDLLSYGLSLGLRQVVAAGVSASGGRNEKRSDNDKGAEGRSLLHMNLHAILHTILHTKHGNLLRNGNFLRDLESVTIVRPA